MVIEERPTVVFLCAPSLGILDNWLPVLDQVKRETGVQMLALVPKARILRDVVADDTVMQMAGRVFDGVVTPDGRGGYCVLPSLTASLMCRASHAIRVVGGWLRGGGLARNRVVNAAARSLDTLATRLPDARVAIPVFAFAERVVRRRRPVTLEAIAAQTRVLCYDVSEEDKRYVQRPLGALASANWVSLRHGIDIVLPQGAARRRSDDRPRVTTFLFSELERPGYIDNFGVDERSGSVIVTGVPRHERDWMAHVTRSSERNHRVSGNDSVLLLSRPANRAYLPADRKRSALEDIRDVVREAGLTLLVKRHPKEGYDGLFEEVFGRGEYGRFWRYTRAHPLHLAQHVRVAVVFLSGVSGDMIVNGVPVIERLDLRGLDKFDVPGAPRDARGRPVLQYRLHGLVLGADDRDDLRAQLDASLHRRAEVMGGLEQAYSRVFGEPDGSIREVTRAVVSGLSG